MGIEQLDSGGALEVRLSWVLFPSLLYPTVFSALLPGAASPCGDAQGLRRCQSPEWPRELPGSGLSSVLCPSPRAGRALQALLNGHQRVQLQLWNALCRESLPGPANICSDIGTALANIPASQFSALLEYSWEVNVRRGTA